MIAENRIECDVLVVGGGIAGCFAAVKAKEQNAHVILADKGCVGKSGQSPFANSIMAFNADEGHDLDAWMRYENKTGEYINNRYWTEQCIKGSWSIYRELISWGLEFKQDKAYDPGRYDSSTPKGLFETKAYAAADMSKILRRRVAESGVKIIDRVMIAELLKQNGRIIGAVGISPVVDELYIFIAKTTILCVGACGFKPIGYAPLNLLTCDGEAMSYRAGAEIGGKEFVSAHFGRIGVPSLFCRKIALPEIDAMIGKEPGFALIKELYNAEGDRINKRPQGASGYMFTYLQAELEAHEGRAPIIWRTPNGNKNIVGGAALGMSLRKCDGLWPANAECASTVPGLYAAGDSLYTNSNGASYSLEGSSMSGSALTGSIAGKAAAREALGMSGPVAEESIVDQAKRTVLAPCERQGGYGPRWVIQLLQNTMLPYFVSYIKKEDRLQAALTVVMFMQEHLIPMVFAKDYHELRLAHEAKNMVLSAEMRLRSSSFRKESRGNHYREDYPRRNDPDWLAWTKIKEDHGEMRLEKAPVPQEWLPDLSVPYEDRYPFRFPGE
ncbi:MAG: FAD-binding protein [Clostridiales Family XIII bacterium]|nr:FAD-binding protein [Clostridiales Family XIII bacterium]